MEGITLPAVLVLNRADLSITFADITGVAEDLTLRLTSTRSREHWHDRKSL